MKYKDTHPEHVHLRTKDFLSEVPPQAIFNVFKDLIDWYQVNLPLWVVLNFFGEHLTGNEDEQQVQCRLPEHGTRDNHASARYFSYDRDTGKQKQTIHCFKCQKSTNSIGLLFKHLTQTQGMKPVEVFQFIEDNFQLEFPKSIVLEFDPETYYSFDGPSNLLMQELIDLNNKIQESRALKLQGVAPFRHRLKEILL